MEVRMESKSKKQLYLLFGLLAVLCIGIGVALAVLITNTEQRANIFKSGKVDIELEEEEWVKNKPEDKVTKPGRYINKDPRITNTGDTDAYLYLEVQVPKDEVRTAGSDGKMTAKAVVPLFSYEINEPAGSDAGWIALDEFTDETGAEFNVYVYGYSEIGKTGSKTKTLFDRVQFAPVIEGDIPKGTELTMPISAYAIQAEYLGEEGDTVTEKLTDAFRKYKAEPK